MRTLLKLLMTTIMAGAGSSGALLGGNGAIAQVVPPSPSCHPVQTEVLKSAAGQAKAAWAASPGTNSHAARTAAHDALAAYAGTPFTLNVTAQIHAYTG